MLLSTSIGFADEHFPFLGTVSRGPVNVRSGANTNFEIVAKLTASENVVVLGKSYEWYKIQLPLAANVYIRADYIKLLDARSGEIIGSKVNLRSKPDSNASILGQLSRGDLVKLDKQENDWWKIEPSSTAVAWIHSSFVEKSKSSTSLNDVLRTPLTKESIMPPRPPVVEKPVIPLFHAQGVLQPIAESSVPGVHYKLVSGGQTMCYVGDRDGLSRFRGVLVSLEGQQDPNAAVMSAPVVAIKKVAVLL